MSEHQAGTLTRYDQSSKLRRSLQLVYVYALATGAIYTFIGYWDGIFMSQAGPATFLSFGMMTLMVLPIAFVYSEMATMMPNTGAELVFNTIGLSKHFGFLSSWMIMAAWLVVPPAGIMGIVDWVAFSFNIEVSLGQLSLITAVVLSVFCTLSLLNIQIAGRAQAFMLFSSLAIVLTTSILFIFSKNASLSNFTPFIASGISRAGETLTRQGVPASGGYNWYGWMVGTALLVNPYFGFELVPQMVEEGTFPIKDQKKAIIGSVVTCGLIYSIFYFALQLVKPWGDLTNGGDMSPFIALKVIQEQLSWLPGWFWLFGIASVLFAIGTCVLGFWIGGVRLMYAMGRQGFLPKIFSKTNRFDQPIVPNIMILALALIQLSFQDAAFLQSFYTMMGFCCGTAYLITVLSSIRLAATKPHWERPYRLPGGMPFRIMALVFCLFIMLGTGLGQTAGSWRSMFVYILVGAALYLYMRVFRWTKNPVWMICPSDDKPGEFVEKEF